MGVLFSECLGGVVIFFFLWFPIWSRVAVKHPKWASSGNPALLEKPFDGERTY